MQKSTDKKNFEKKSIRSAVIGLVIFTVIMILTEILMLFCQFEDPIPKTAVILISLCVILPVIGAVITLLIRINEIKKGEEYEASKY